MMASRALRSPRELGYRGRQIVAMLRSGRSPTLAQIRDELGFHDEAGVLRVIQRLEKRAIVRRVKARRRCRLRLVINNKSQSRSKAVK
jgi:SOS-response transcriptional repressor LexA